MKSVIASSRLLISAATIALLGMHSVPSASAAERDNPSYKRLEKGETISSKAGSSVTFQKLLKVDIAKAVAVLDDLSKLPELFENIVYAKTFKTLDGKKLLYIKVSGLGDGAGLLFEVKESGGDFFTAAKTLLKSSDGLRLREIGTEASLEDGGHADLVKDLAIETDKAKKTNGMGREIDTSINARSLILEGPLNEVMQLPANRFSLHLGVGTYSLFKADTPWDMQSSAYLVAKIGVASQTPRTELGDVKGFGERKLSLLQRFGQNVFTNFAKQLSKL